jgi:hypothetical protein
LFFLHHSAFILHLFLILSILSFFILSILFEFPVHRWNFYEGRACFGMHGRDALTWHSGIRQACVELERIRRTLMSLPPPRRTLLILALAFVILLVNHVETHAQQQNLNASVASAQPRSDDDTDLEIHLQLLIGSNTAGAGASLPNSLDGALKQLRANMQLTNYRLGATFLHRVKSGSGLEVKGTGGVLPIGVAPSPASNPYIPTFYEFTMRPVELHTSATGQPVVSIPIFHFGMRVPVLVAIPNPKEGNAPAVQYETTGITTGLSIAEGQPVVVGTLYSGPDNEAIIVLLTAKKVAPR